MTFKSFVEIEFESPRAGHGADLLKLLVTMSDKYGVHNVGIEGANDSLASFAGKYGFTELQDKQWIIDVSMLKQNHNM